MDWAARSPTIRSIARWSLIVLMTAPVTTPVRSRLLIRARECTTQFPKKIPEGPRFHHISRCDQHAD